MNSDTILLCADCDCSGVVEIPAPNATCPECGSTDLVQMGTKQFNEMITGGLDWDA